MGGRRLVQHLPLFSLSSLSEALHASKIVYTAACPMVNWKAQWLMQRVRIKTRGIVCECCTEL